MFIFAAASPLYGFLMLVACGTDDLALSVDAVESLSIDEQLLLISARCSKEYMGYMGSGLNLNLNLKIDLDLFSNQMMLPTGG